MFFEISTVSTIWQIKGEKSLKDKIDIHNGLHYCNIHNCPFWEKCPLCLFDIELLNPSERYSKVK